jgi:hypothetical protein
MNSINLHTNLKKALDTNNVVLINGPWGCGKTYQIKTFVDVNANDLDLVYISLFGIHSHDDLINTICAKVNPALYYSKKIGRFALSAISKTSITITKDNEDISTNLSFALNMKDNNQSVKITGNKRKIIIFDDLERINFDDITIIDVLGIIENLIYQRFKIIIVANLDEIKETDQKEFQKFFEKVIDKRIDIQDVDLDIIYSYFEEDGDLDFSYLMETCNSNIRFVQRVSNLYQELLSALKEKKIDNNVYNNQMILDVCSDLIAGLFSNTFVEKYVEEKKNKQDDDIDWRFIDIPSFDNYGPDISERLEAICFVANYGLNEPKINLLRALISFHINGETDELKDVFHTDGSVLDEYYNLFADDELDDLFRRQTEYILYEENESVTKILNALEPIFRVSDDELICEYREKLKKHILTNRSRFKEKLDEYPLHLHGENKKYQCFIDEIREQIKADEIASLLGDFNDNYDKEDYKECLTLIRRLCAEINSLDDEQKSKVTNYFKSKNYLFDYIEQHMPNVEYWTMLQSVTRLYERIGCIADSKNYLGNLVNADKNNKALQRRFIYLYGENNSNYEK